MDDFLFNQIRNHWVSLINEPSEENYNLDILKRFSFLDYLESNSIAYCILNNNKFEIHYFSHNFWDVLGIDKSNHEKYGSTVIINQMAKKHVQYYTLISSYFVDYWETISEANKKDIVRTTVGLIYNHKDKGEIRIAIQTYILEVNSNLVPTYFFVIFHNVTHMMKDDFFWIRFSCNDESEKSITYHDGQKEVLKDDIISKREKEILHLINLGKSTEEIAQTLFISKITVNNHRQNMLNRLGVKDTTALITIAKLCKLI